MARKRRSNEDRFMERDVHVIRVLLHIGCTQSEIARRYGVTQTNISCIAAGKTWQNVTTEIPRRA